MLRAKARLQLQVVVCVKLVLTNPHALLSQGIKVTDSESKHKLLKLLKTEQARKLAAMDAGERNFVHVYAVNCARTGCFTLETAATHLQTAAKRAAA